MGAGMPSLAEQINAEVADAPPEMQREVLDFAKFLRQRADGRRDERVHLLDLAQTSWSAEWDNPDEDEAWASL